MSETVISFKWEWFFAIVVVVCATVALCLKVLDQNIWYQVLVLLTAFLGGTGLGYVKGKRDPS